MSDRRIMNNLDKVIKINNYILLSISITKKLYEKIIVKQRRFSIKFLLNHENFVYYYVINLNKNYSNRQRNFSKKCYITLNLIAFSQREDGWKFLDLILRISYSSVLVLCRNDGHVKKVHFQVIANSLYCIPNTY